MAFNESLVDPQGTRLDIVATQAGRVGIDLNVIEAGVALKTFHIASPDELLLLLGALVAAGTYIGWIDRETETVVGTALLAEARKPRRTDESEPTPSV